MPDRGAMRARRLLDEKFQGIKPRLDGRTFGLLKALHQAGRAGNACADWRDYLTEVFHAGRQADRLIWSNARQEVVGAKPEHTISLKLSRSDLVAMGAVAGTSRKSDIAICIAAYVRAGFEVTGGRVDCVAARIGTYT